MSQGTYSGLVTLFLFVAFISGVFWAYSKKRKPEFDAAALLPLDEEDTPNANRPVAFATHKSENAQ